MLRACALVLLCGVPVASPALVSPVVACTWLLPCETPGSGAVGRGLQPEDAVVVFARSCGSVCNKQPTHTTYLSTIGLSIIHLSIYPWCEGHYLSSKAHRNPENPDLDTERMNAIRCCHQR